MKYFYLSDAINLIEDRWFLKSLNVVDENKVSVWDFRKPTALKLPENDLLSMSIRDSGVPLDFTFADFEVLVVNEKVAAILPDDECQLLPLKINGINSRHIYFVAILLKALDCVDENRSVFEKWTKDDPIRPDLAGRYKGIYKLFVDPNKIPQTKIFRLQKSLQTIVVDESIKRAFELNNITGVKFEDVT